MPQITVNEIDQSVVTRVVSDDKVKILCPIIASFGPAYDGTQESIKTFTDVTDFNRAFGYTYAEFNPFEDDHSRMYARELIKKGAAVSVVRINGGGNTAQLQIEGSSSREETTGFNTVCNAALASPELQNLVKSATVTQLSGASNNQLGFSRIVPGSFYLTVTVSTESFTLNDFNKDGNLYFYNKDGSQHNIATLDYATGTLTLTSAQTPPVFVKASFNYFDTTNVTLDWNKYTFCPQIESIQAKYTGSFGNDIAISISQINTTRVAESYQYASISVYYIDNIINYNVDDNGIPSVKKSVKSITLLENKLVSTNPDDPNYFEDVEFDFIRIIPKSTAREELRFVWSNINNNPTSATRYSGFPVIPIKYNPGPLPNSVQQYNYDCIMSNGSDFAYSVNTLQKLNSGFKGYWTSNWSLQDVNTYMGEVYGDDTHTGIIPQIYTQLSSLYNNYTDPYIYDFDFITSSGFVYEEFELAYDTTTETLTLTGADSKTATFSSTADQNGTIVVNAKTTDNEDVQYVSEGDKLMFKTSQVGTITYGTNATSITIVAATASDIQNSVTVSYNDTKKAKVALPKVPFISDSEYAQYTSVTPIHESMRNLVNTRQDCIALFDVPYNYDKNAIVDYSYLLNTSYGTIHNPWCYVNSPDIAGQQILMAPSYIFLYTFLSNLIDNVESQKWFPPAGVERATARVVVRPYYEIGSVTLNEWQNDNISRVNPIMKLKQYGYVIYGQYTTLPAIDLYTHSALESLNVRLISNVVKKKIFDTCLNLAFEPNTSALWLKFFAQLDPFLRYMKYNNGLYDYKIVMDESTVTTDDINHLRCPGKVYIAPTRTAEFFDIDFIITDAGAVFSD